jgi:hypothetical protein
MKRIALLVLWVLLGQSLTTNELLFPPVPFGTGNQGYFACENVVLLWGFTKSDQAVYWSCKAVPDDKLVTP